MTRVTIPTASLLMPDVLALLGDQATRERLPPFEISPAEDAASIASHHWLRRNVFVEEQGLFERHDRDDFDDDPRTVVLLARDRADAVVGGVRLHPAVPGGPEIGWWYGSRLAVYPESLARKIKRLTTINSNGPG